MNPIPGNTQGLRGNSAIRRAAMDYDRWLSSEVPPIDLLRPYSSKKMTAYEIGQQARLRRAGHHLSCASQGRRPRLASRALALSRFHNSSLPSLQPSSCARQGGGSGTFIAASEASDRFSNSAALAMLWQAWEKAGDEAPQGYR